MQEHRRNESNPQPKSHGSIDNNARHRTQDSKDLLGYIPAAGQTISSSPDFLGSGATLDGREGRARDSEDFIQNPKRGHESHLTEPAQLDSVLGFQKETLEDLKSAIVELYLAIKIRSTEEVSF